MSNLKQDIKALLHEFFGSKIDLIIENHSKHHSHEETYRFTERLLSELVGKEKAEAYLVPLAIKHKIKLERKK